MREWITRMTGLELWISGAYSRYSCTAPMQFTVSLAYHTNLLMRSPLCFRQKERIKIQPLCSRWFLFLLERTSSFLDNIVELFDQQGSQFPTTIIFSKEIFLLKRKMDRKRSLFRKERERKVGESARERERKCKNNDKVNFFRLMCGTYHDGKKYAQLFMTAITIKRDRAR